MEGMISYIFGALRNSEKSVRDILNTLNKQKRLNQTFVIFSLTAIVYLYMADIYRYGQEKRIDELEREIEELKHTKGE